ncbi:MAG TPA: hypothetical protein VFV38_17040 [Ktedonobacteraceae bacterium]|nr:hypothetical protein [Ktedonobacteraceae bacterium]
MSLPSPKTVRDTVQVALSRAIAAAIDAQKHHCAVNAWRALILFPEHFRDGGHLVEGWLVIEDAEQVTLVEHVWCERANEQVVDPSILLLVPETTLVAYFPGVRRSYAEAEALEGAWFPHVRFDGLHGVDGLGHAGYQAARTAARHLTATLALKRQPPKAMRFVTAQDGEHTGVRETEEILGEGAPLELHGSVTTALATQAVLGRCWYNARAALREMPNEFLSASYVEGWVVGQWTDVIRLIEHGWVWRPRTGIVDPTIVLDQLPRRLVYFPGLELSWHEIQQYETTLLPLARELGLGLLAYQQACQQALHRAEALAWQTGLPIVTEPGRTQVFERQGDRLLPLANASWAFPVPSTSSAGSLAHSTQAAQRQHAEQDRSE